MTNIAVELFRFLFFSDIIHFKLIVKKNQVARSFPTEILLDRIADDNIKITNIFR
jgi:hypothetical protein